MSGIPAVATRREGPRKAEAQRGGDGRKGEGERMEAGKRGGEVRECSGIHPSGGDPSRGTRQG